MPYLHSNLMTNIGSLTVSTRFYR